MTERVIRIRINEVLYKKYKVFCAVNDLSIPIQTQNLIRSFININDKVEIPYEVIEKIGNK